MRAAQVLINGGERYVRRDVLERLGITGRRIDDPALLLRDDAEYRRGAE